MLPQGHWRPQDGDSQRALSLVSTCSRNSTRVGSPVSADATGLYSAHRYSNTVLKPQRTPVSLQMGKGQKLPID